MAKTSKQVRWCGQCGKDKYFDIRLHEPTGERIVFCSAGHAIGKIVVTKVGRHRSGKELRYENGMAVLREELKGKL